MIFKDLYLDEKLFETPLEILEYKDKYLDDTARIRALP